MTPDVILKLGDFAFARYEIPERIPFGGEQRLVVHELVGGKRVVDAMGESPAPIEWSGFFVGKQALERARYVDGLRRAGRVLPLSWGGFSYRVVVRTFHCDFLRVYRLAYRITCEVVTDLTAPVNQVPAPSVGQLIAGDLKSANGLAGALGDGPLGSLMGTLNSAISGVSDFAKAAQSTLNTVLQPISEVRSRVGVLMQSVSGTIQNVTSLGGVLPGNPLAQQANKLLDHLNVVNQSSMLLQLDNAMGRMQSNIGTLTSGARQVASAGGNLYDLAAKEFGDPMTWPLIGRANGINDPQVVGVKTLVIPPPPLTDETYLHA